MNRWDIGRGFVGLTRAREERIGWETIQDKSDVSTDGTDVH